MRFLTALVAFVAASLSGLSAFGQGSQFLSWSAKQAQTIGNSGFKQGRVGGWFDARVINTDRSYNYKLAATFFSPDVVRASLRMRQLALRLPDQSVTDLAHEAIVERLGFVVLIEIDPREGSGVIPREWHAFLEPFETADAARNKNGVPLREGTAGVLAPALREEPAFAGVRRRDYAYDQFWLEFDREKTFGGLKDTVGALRLVVRIYNKEGRVEWPLDASMTQIVK